MKVFLGGTCADSKWREKLIPMLNVNYFNPVTHQWDEAARQEEIKQRKECDLVLYVLSRIYSTYSIAETVDDSNKRPQKTICCVINEKFSNNKLILNKQDLKHLDQVGKMVERNGGKYFKSLEETADYINKISIKDFKVGDRVEVFQLIEPAEKASIGDTGTIIKITNDLKYPVKVNLDNGTENYWFNQGELIHYGQ